MKLNQQRTKIINRLQKRFPGTTRQRNEHGCGVWSVEFFSRQTGKLVARFESANDEQPRQTL